MKLTVAQKVVLNQISFGIGNVTQRNGRMNSKCGYMICEGEWNASKGYDDFPHPFKVEIQVELNRSEKLMEEILYSSRLEGTYELKINHVVIQMDALERTPRERQYTHRITLKGSGHVSEKIWESLGFKTTFPASETVCAMIRDILRDYMGASDMEQFPRKAY